MADETIVQRSTLIQAVAAEILPSLIDFHRWRDWSPWEDVDPDLKRSYSGPDSGVGAEYQWTGNRKAGAGRMRVDSIADGSVNIHLLFTRPFKSQSRAVFQLIEGAERTEVVWRIITPRTTLMRLFGFLINLEKTVGPDLERGLARLKGIHES